MRVKSTLTASTAIAFAVALTAMATGSAFAQGRPANDGGIPAAPTGSPQYSASGQVVPAPAGTESAGNCAARYHSFDPTTGTYVGRDGHRHPCS